MGPQQGETFTASCGRREEENDQGFVERDDLERCYFGHRPDHPVDVTALARFFLFRRLGGLRLLHARHILVLWSGCGQALGLVGRQLLFFACLPTASFKLGYQFDAGKAAILAKCVVVR